MSDTSTRRRRLPGLRAWCVGTPVGLVLGALLVTAWLATHPATTLSAASRLLQQTRWRLSVDGATMDYGDGLLSPSTWCWRVRNLTLVGVLPHQPTFLLDDVALTPPRPAWAADGLVLTLARAHVARFDLHIDQVVRQEAQPLGTDRWAIVVEALEVDAFGLTMRQGRNPEVIVEASDVSLVGPFRIQPALRQLTGELTLRTATVEIAGVRARDVQAQRVAFTGRDFHASASGQLGDGRLDATLTIAPLIGPPLVTATAKLRDGTLGGLADAILGPGSLPVFGRVDATAHLEAGAARGPGQLAGTATVDVHDAGFTRPTSHRSAVALAVTLAPFLRFDGDGNVLVGDLHGGVSFTQRGVSFDSIQYETRHSVGAVRGYVRSTSVSAKLHFEPRPRSGAIEWGLVLRGDLRKPRLSLATAALLRAWTPCDDPHDCPLVGGASTAGVESSEADETTARGLAREARRRERDEARRPRGAGEGESDP